MNQQLKVLFLLAFVLILQACETKTMNTQQKESAQTTEECTIDSIPATEGVEMIDEAQTYIASVNTTITGNNPKIPFGAKIPVCELQEILNDLGEEPEVWAMLAMKDGELEIVFQGKEDAGSTNYKYYDFTIPCPKMCPYED